MVRQSPGDSKSSISTLPKMFLLGGRGEWVDLGIIYGSLRLIALNWKKIRGTLSYLPSVQEHPSSLDPLQDGIQDGIQTKLDKALSGTPVWLQSCRPHSASLHLPIPGACCALNNGMSPVSLAASHWWALGIVSAWSPLLRLAAEPVWEPDRSFYRCSTRCVSLNALSIGLLPLFGGSGALLLLLHSAALSLHDVVHPAPWVIQMLPSVSLWFSTIQDCVCSIGLSVLGQSFQNVLNESSAPLQRYYT